MLRKDFVLAEIRQLTQALATMASLREQRLDEAWKKLLHDTLSKNFDLDPAQFSELSDIQFQSYLDIKKYRAEKLDMLARLLFEKSRDRENLPESINLLKKVLLLFDLMEKEHHVQSLENINRRSMIEKIIKMNINE